MKKILSVFAIVGLLLSGSVQANPKPTSKAKTAKAKSAKAKKPAKKPAKDAATDSAPVLDENGQRVRTMQDDLLAE